MEKLKCWLDRGLAVIKRVASALLCTNLTNEPKDVADRVLCMYDEKLKWNLYNVFDMFAGLIRVLPQKYEEREHVRIRA